MDIRLTRDVILPTGVILTDSVWNKSNNDKHFKSICEINEYIKSLNHTKESVVFLYHASTKEYPYMYNVISVSEKKAKAMGIKGDAYLGKDNKDSYIAVSFIEAQKYMDFDGFEKESEMIISDTMVNRYGISSYFINERWKSEIDNKNRILT